MRPDVEEATRKLAMKKLADRYVGRAGEPPSLRARQKAAKSQDLTEDDRKHMRWSLDVVRHGLLRKDATATMDAHAALDFIVAILARDYGLYLGVERPEDADNVVNEGLDPDLYRHMMGKRR